MHQEDQPQFSRRKIMQCAGGGAAAFTVAFGLAEPTPISAGQIEATPEAEGWAALERRPLKLPTLTTGQRCPRTESHHLVSPEVGFPLGSGPAYAGMPSIGATNLDMHRPSAPGWYGFKILWWATPGRASRRILVRGRHLDGEGDVRFSREGPVGNPADLPAEMRLEGPAVGVPWPNWASTLFVQTPGCYACQVDGADFSETIAFEAVGKLPGELTPVPPFKPGNRRGELRVDAAVPIDRDTVRLALVGLGLLAVQLDVTPSRTAPVELSGGDVQQAAYSHGTVVWTPFPGRTVPQFAAWDDGRRRYRLEVLDGFEPGAWTEADLLKLVEAFTAAPENEATPAPSG